MAGAMAATLDREKVREALESLHDNVALAACGLAEQLAAARHLAAAEERADAVRALLLEAIESLRPRRRGGGIVGADASGRPGGQALPAGQTRGSAPTFGSPETREYDVLTLRYLERMPVARMEDELALGRRQIYRDLEEAEERLAKVLSVLTRATPGPGPVPARDSLAHELSALPVHPTRFELRALVLEAIELVEPLLARSGAKATLSGAEEQGFVFADRAVAKQVLAQLLSSAAAGGAARLEVSLASSQGAERRVDLRFHGSLEGVERRVEDAQRIAISRGMRCTAARTGDGAWEVSLTLPAGAPLSVLVVEDNPGAIELYRRYLEPSGWLVHSVSDPRIAREVAQRLRPDVILLDVMMPWLDGWTLLQHLRRGDELSEIPVVVCSVVEQPELAAALGARAYLPKPVSQLELLAALRSCVERPS
jgi:CheY-like chemotaxis protein